MRHWFNTQNINQLTEHTDISLQQQNVLSGKDLRATNGLTYRCIHRIYMHTEVETRLKYLKSFTWTAGISMKPVKNCILNFQLLIELSKSSKMGRKIIHMQRNWSCNEIGMI